MRYEIKALGVGGILDQAIKLLKDHFGLLMGISCCISVPFGLLVGFVQLAIAPELPPNPTPEDFIAFQQAALANLVYIAPLGLLSLIFVYPVTNAATIYAIANEYLGKSVTVGASISRAFQVLIPLLWTSFLMFLLVYVGLIFCILPGILLLFRYALSSFAVVLEGQSGPSALKRSKELMLFDRTKNYNTLFLVGLLVGAINYGIVLGGAFIPQQHLAMVTTVLLQAVGAALSSAALAVFYFSCRCKAENFDLVHLAEAMSVDANEDDADEI